MNRNFASEMFKKSIAAYDAEIDPRQKKRYSDEAEMWLKNMSKFPSQKAYDTICANNINSCSYNSYPSSNVCGTMYGINIYCGNPTNL